MRCSAERCTADPGPPRTETVPGLQRTTSCCAAPGTRRGGEYPMHAPQAIETRPGVTYATHDGIALLGDLYLPAGAGPFPALVAAHGGGWQAGARSAFQFWGPYLAARGYVLFAISYRLAKKGHKAFPQAVTD